MKIATKTKKKKGKTKDKLHTRMETMTVALRMTNAHLKNCKTETHRWKPRYNGQTKKKKKNK